MATYPTELRLLTLKDATHVHSHHHHQWRLLLRRDATAASVARSLNVPLNELFLVKVNRNGEFAIVDSFQKNPSAPMASVRLYVLRVPAAAQSTVPALRSHDVELGGGPVSRRRAAAAAAASRRKQRGSRSSRPAGKKATSTSRTKKRAASRRHKKTKTPNKRKSTPNKRKSTPKRR